MACKEGQFDVFKIMVNNQFKDFSDFSINLNAQHVNWMTPFDVLYQFECSNCEWNDSIWYFSINLNAQNVNGMTPFDLALCTVIRYSRVFLCFED